LSQSIQPPSLALHPASNTYRPLPPSRSTSTSRYPPSYLPSHHAHSLSHESYLPESYGTPLQTPCPIDESTRSLSRPRILRRSSSYDFGRAGSGVSQSRATSPYTEYSAFEGDAFAPLVQDTCANGNPGGYSADPWARWKQQSPESTSVWAAFGKQQQQQQQQSQQMKQFAAAQQQQRNPFGCDRFQSPIRAQVDRPPTPPDEEDEMMDTEMENEDEDAVEREMGYGYGEADGQHIIRPGSAPGAMGGDWREQGFGGAGWERGRRNI
jgi:hypothetical protein